MTPIKRIFACKISCHNHHTLPSDVILRRTTFFQPIGHWSLVYLLYL